MLNISLERTTLMKDILFYTNENVRRRAKKLALDFIIKFGSTIDERFHRDIDFYKKTRYLFASLTKKAIRSKGKGLSQDEASKLAKLRVLFRTIGKLDRHCLEYTVRIDGKPTRVPVKVTIWLLKQYGFAVKKHGKHFSKNEHWSNFILPSIKKVDELYRIYTKEKAKI